MKCAFMRATKLYDLHHGEQIRAENLRRVEKAALADVHKNVKLLEEVVATHKGVIEDLPQENLKLQTAYKGNAEVLASALSTLGRLEHFIADHKGDLERESKLTRPAPGDHLGGHDAGDIRAVDVSTVPDFLTPSPPHSKVCNSTINKALGVEWREMSEATKQPYVEKVTYETSRDDMQSEE